MKIPKDHRIHTRVLTDEEYTKLQKKANQANIKLNDYITAMSLNGMIVKFNYDVLLENSREISELKNSIINLTLAIINTTNWKFKEIDEIMTSLDYLINNHKELMKEISRIENKLLKEVGLKKVQNHDC